MEGLRMMNEDEIYYLCKIILEDKRNISVGKTIMRYASLQANKDLFRTIHSRLLQSGKYEETHEVDKYGLKRIRYSPKKSWPERNWLTVEIFKILLPLVIGYFIGVATEQKDKKQQNTKQEVRNNAKDSAKQH